MWPRPVSTFDLEPELANHRAVVAVGADGVVRDHQDLFTRNAIAAPRHDPVGLLAHRDQFEVEDHLGTELLRRLTEDRLEDVLRDVRGTLGLAAA